MRWTWCDSFSGSEYVLFFGAAYVMISSCIGKQYNVGLKPKLCARPNYAAGTVLCTIL